MTDKLTVKLCAHTHASKVMTLLMMPKKMKMPRYTKYFAPYIVPRDSDFLINQNNLNSQGYKLAVLSHGSSRSQNSH